MSSRLISNPALRGSLHHSRASRWLGAASISAHASSTASAVSCTSGPPLPNPPPVARQNLYPMLSTTTVIPIATRVDVRMPVISMMIPPARLIQRQHHVLLPDVPDRGLAHLAGELRLRGEQVLSPGPVLRQRHHHRPRHAGAVIRLLDVRD